jgi:ribosomal-protein-alanine N-acetyltransferase
MHDTLLTIRLQLRPVNEGDLEAIHELHSLPETDLYNTLGIPENIEVTKNILAGFLNDHGASPRVNYYFAVLLKETGQFIGLAALKLSKAKYNNGEMWYKLHRDHWGQGYVTEAVTAIIHFGLHDLGLHRLEAGCAVGNIGSVRVLEKAGMVSEGRKRQHLPLKSGWSDCFEYGLLKEDLEK